MTKQVAVSRGKQNGCKSLRVASRLVLLGLTERVLFDAYDTTVRSRWVDCTLAPACAPFCPQTRKNTPENCRKIADFAAKIRHFSQNAPQKCPIIFTPQNPPKLPQNPAKSQDFSAQK